MLCSEIFSVTAPIWRAAALLAGPGFIVAAPAIDHEFEPAGTVLPSDQPGADRGNLLQTTPPPRRLRRRRPRRPRFSAQRRVLHRPTRRPGLCLGGHLDVRAAINPAVLAATGHSATDRHPRGLGAGLADDRLERISEITRELLLIWGRQDPTGLSRAASVSKSL